MLVFRSSRVGATPLMSALVYLLAPAYMALACGTELPVVALMIGSTELQVEIAATPSARACGLSRRDHLDPEAGMLFVFPDPARRAFWMHETRIPLSIAFLDADRQIINSHDMAPMQTEERYPSDGPASYALEVNLGWFDEHGIGTGDRAEFSLPKVLLIE